MIRRIKEELKSFDGLGEYKYSSKYASYVYKDVDRVLRINIEVIRSGMGKKIIGGYGMVELDMLKRHYADLNEKYLFLPSHTHFNHLFTKSSLIADFSLKRSINEPYATEVELLDRIERFKHNVEINVLPFFERYKSLDAIYEHIESFSYQELSNESILYNNWPLRQFDGIILAKYGGLTDRYNLWLDALYSVIRKRKTESNKRQKAENEERALEVLLQRLNRAPQISHVVLTDAEPGIIDETEQGSDPLILPSSYMGFIIKDSLTQDLSEALKDILGGNWTLSSENIILQDAVNGDMSSSNISVYEQGGNLLCIVSNSDIMQQISADAISAGQHSVLIYGAEDVSGLRVLRRFDMGAETIHHVDADSNIMIDHRATGYESTASIDEQIRTQIESFLGSSLTSLSGSSPCTVYKLTL